MSEKPKPTSSLAEKELNRLDQQFKAHEEQVQSLTHDRLNATPKEEIEPQTKLAQSEIAKTNDIYLKPIRSIGSPQKFNEKFRDLWNFDKEYVHFIAENHEIIGEEIDIWTRPYGGVPAEEWKVPVNKPVWGPRYLAEQIKRKFYHRLTMANTTPTENVGVGQMYGAMTVDTTIPRLDARPVSDRKSIFMGAKTFG